MGVVAKPRCAVVFLMVLTLGVSLGLPAEDVLDAVYDESETLPFDVLLDSNVVSLMADGATLAPRSALPLDLVAPPPCAPARVRNGEAHVHRSSDTRVSLALLCTLLC